MALPLLQTKLYIPRRHSSALVARPRLFAQVAAGLAARLLLVSAPTGFGKSTLLSGWIAQSAAQLAPDSPKFAWLSLDEADDDPTRFWSYVVAALQTVYPTLGASVVALLQAPEAPPAESLLILLINELLEYRDRLVLVLDDYHLIQNDAIQRALTFLIDHQPPSFHLALLTRSDPPLPLARWRAHGQMAEIRAADLRCTLAETTAFLNEQMELDLPMPAVSTLEQRTEGWIAGLQLAALSLQGREDRVEFVEAFSGSHRHVLSFLVEEVLNRCSPATLSFLLQSSILDQLCGPLCDTLIDDQQVASRAQDDSTRPHAQAMLDQLLQANLFLIPLDDTGTWYRYHHLFVQVLRVRLQVAVGAQPVFALHSRASVWYEENGLLDDAMRHALALPDLARAVELVERYATKLLMQSELMVLRKWMAHLPGALVSTRPRLALAQGWVLDMIGQLDAADEMLNLPALQSSDLPDDLAGELALVRADIANSRHEPIALTWAQQALDLLPPHREDLRVIARIEIGLAHMRRGELAAASQTLHEVVAVAESVQNRFVALDALAAFCSIQVRQGQLFQALQTCEQALRMVARWDGSPPPATGMIYVSLGEIRTEWNELDEATQALTHGLRLLQGTIEKMPVAHGYGALARIQQAQGNPAGALASLASAEAWFAQLDITETPALVWLARRRTRLWLRQGNLAAALHWADASTPPFETEPACDHLLTLVRLYLAQYRRTPDHALPSQIDALLAAVCARAETDGWPLYLLEGQLLRALSAHAQNHLPDAFAALTTALTLAESGGYLRLFWDEGEPMRLLMLDFGFWIARQPANENQARLSAYADRLLAAFATHRLLDQQTALATPPTIQNSKSKIQNLVEPLSSRELEVLHLIAAGLSNQEIAARLVVTVGTVKSHVNHLFGKLAVISRTQAVARARELGLLTG
jgi:LuxR family transcriptional regulator, maltose regulon positive regulatory protein